MIFLETERLLFRSHEARDEADFVSMHTDAEVRRYVGGKAWPVEKAHSRFREQYLGRPAETYGLWSTVFKAEGKYIGCCNLRAPGNGMARFVLPQRRTCLSLTMLPPTMPRAARGR